MPRKNRWKPPEEIRAEREAMQAARLPEAIELMATPLGQALCQPGVTLRHWASSNPSNVWVENEAGDYLFHSVDKGVYCPVRRAFITLRPFLDEVPHDMGAGGQSFSLPPEAIAKLVQVKMEAETEPAKKTPRAGLRI